MEIGETFAYNVAKSVFSRKIIFLYSLSFSLSKFVLLGGRTFPTYHMSQLFKFFFFTKKSKIIWGYLIYYEWENLLDSNHCTFRYFMLVPSMATFLFLMFSWNLIEAKSFFIFQFSQYSWMKIENSRATKVCFSWPSELHLFNKYVREEFFLASY